MASQRKYTYVHLMATCTQAHDYCCMHHNTKDVAIVEVNRCGAKNSEIQKSLF